MKTILIQGAMDNEINRLVAMFETKLHIKINGCDFYETTTPDKRIIISKTGVGIMNACVATMTAIERYHPDCIINQGIAGAHRPDLRIGDLIVGDSAVYLNSHRSPIKSQGKGSNALLWKPGKKQSCDISSDRRLLGIFEKLPFSGRKIVGKLGSGDMFSREVDRINLLVSQFGEISEDMETAAVYKCAKMCGVAVIGVRIIANNELLRIHTNGVSDKTVCEKLQDFIYSSIDCL